MQEWTDGEAHNHTTCVEWPSKFGEAGTLMPEKVDFCIVQSLVKKMDCCAIITVQAFLQSFWWRYSFIFLWGRYLLLQRVIVKCGYLCSPTPFQTCDTSCVAIIFWRLMQRKPWKTVRKMGWLKESAIIISHSTKPVSFFCLLFFSNCNFFLSFSSPYFFKNFELASVIRYHISDMAQS